jgi:hypothetical protein
MIALRLPRPNADENSQRDTAPRRGRSGELVHIYFFAKYPRSVFLNRASFPLVLISDRIAEHNVATGSPTLAGVAS